MAYITSLQLQNRYPLLTVWTDDTFQGIPSATVVQEMIDIATGEMDSYARRAGILVPLGLTNAATERMVRNVVGCIAGYKLALRTPNDPMIEDYRKQYDYWVKWLENLRPFDLPGEGQDADTETPHDRIFVMGRGARYITPGRLAGFVGGSISQNSQDLDNEINMDNNS